MPRYSEEPEVQCTQCWRMNKADRITCFHCGVFLPMVKEVYKRRD